MLTQLSEHGEQPSACAAAEQRQVVVLRVVRLLHVDQRRVVVMPVYVDQRRVVVVLLAIVLWQLTIWAADGGCGGDVRRVKWVATAK